MCFGDNPGNYVITDADAIGTGSTGERIRGNVAAVRLVLDRERENRYPTREEQAVFAKYVGWGGLKNVIKGDNSTSRQEREAYAELKRLLTPQQLFWMGQSVLNAHYTPRAVSTVQQATGIQMQDVALFKNVKAPRRSMSGMPTSGSARSTCSRTGAPRTSSRACADPRLLRWRGECTPCVFPRQSA